MNNSGNKSLWGGRFSENTDAFLVQFGASLDVDIALLDADIAGSIAWAKALHRAGVLTADESAAITGGLSRVRDDMRRELDEGSFAFDRTLEDVHMTVEARLTALIGDAGAKLSTRNSHVSDVSAQLPVSVAISRQ